MNLQDDRMPQEQLLYARWLDWGTRAGLALLIGTFVVYMLDLAAPHVSFERVAQVWSLPVDQYRAAVAAPAGWGWLALAAHSDYMNYAGIVLLALVTIACYLRVLPVFVARGDRAYALIAAWQVLVLAIAAAGVLGGAH
jgi:hypothetical protein